MPTMGTWLFVMRIVYHSAGWFVKQNLENIWDKIQTVDNPQQSRCEHLKAERNRLVEDDEQGKGE